MGKLVYTAITSLDGDVADREGSFDWAAPDEEVHAAVNELERLGGPGLAGEAIAAGLVDAFPVFVNPVAVGGGTAWLPDGVRLDLELLGERRFANGVVHLHYRRQGAA